ncbi:putative FBD-associated F-box protein At1g05080 isoform X2 [Citrus clementina]|uniref:putative FBD-associated F-box protein At1g05080 isoform X2 n=1 Tax=Citrus clementina TaxID=85681 RepID=UPI000CECFF3E|nr:putative FBD-associated F-box protein At1g05080 isoform X2 [Citrus x clementina]
MAVALENPKILRLSEGGHDDASEGIDRISNLPESILHHIFSLVEDTLDVITASAVSRKWRYIWLSMPSLAFSTFHKIWSDKRKTLSFHKVNEEFKDFVNWVLMSQNSSITVQSFCLCGYIHESDDYTLYRWMSVLADRKLQELGLMVFSDGPVELLHFLVSCESLVYFKFVFGLHEVLKLPSSAGFVGLNMLSLMNVKFLDCVSFRTFISNCPVLEHLNLLACVFSDMKILDIASVSLKSLVIDNGYPDPGGDGLRNCELKLCLEYLYLTLAHPECFKTSFCNLKSLKLILIPNDQSMNLMVGLLNCFPNLEALTICFAWYETVEFSVEDIPNPSVTYHLKMVELLEVRGGKNELEFMRFLLKHGRALDGMSISWAADIKDPKDITSEIMKFPRTSSTVVLKFLQLKSEVDVSRL